MKWYNTDKYQNDLKFMIVFACQEKASTSCLVKNSTYETQDLFSL